MTHPGGGLHRKGEIFPLEPEGHVDQADQHRHLHQRTDDRGKRRPGLNTEDRDGHGDGQFEIIGGGSEGKGGGLLVSGLPSWTYKKR